MWEMEEALYKTSPTFSKEEDLQTQNAKLRRQLLTAKCNIEKLSHFVSILNTEDQEKLKDNLKILTVYLASINI